MSAAVVTSRRFLGLSAAMAWPAFGVRAKPLKHRYIDIHAHLGAFRYGQYVTVKGLLNWMDELWADRVSSPGSSSGPFDARRALNAWRMFMHPSGMHGRRPIASGDCPPGTPPARAQSL
jgi:hypothetical protein